MRFLIVALSIYFCAVLIDASGHQAFAQGYDVQDLLNARKEALAKRKQGSAAVSDRACDGYEKGVEAILTANANVSNLENLRLSYARCPYYDPYGDLTLTKLVELSKEIEGDDTSRSIKALREYKAIIKRHLANLDVVLMALSNSRKDSKYGEPSRLQKIKQALTKSIINEYKDGTRPDKAITIVTMAEQGYILGQQKAKKIDNELVESAGSFINIYDLASEADGRKYTLFFDVTLPILASRNKLAETTKSREIEMPKK